MKKPDDMNDIEDVNRWLPSADDNRWLPCGTPKMSADDQPVLKLADKTIEYLRGSLIYDWADTDYAILSRADRLEFRMSPGHGEKLINYLGSLPVKKEIFSPIRPSTPGECVGLYVMYPSGGSILYLKYYGLHQVHVQQIDNYIQFVFCGCLNLLNPKKVKLPECEICALEDKLDDRGSCLCLTTN